MAVCLRAATGTKPAPFKLRCHNGHLIQKCKERLHIWQGHVHGRLRCNLCNNVLDRHERRWRCSQHCDYNVCQRCFSDVSSANGGEKFSESGESDSGADSDASFAGYPVDSPGQSDFFHGVSDKADCIDNASGRKLQSSEDDDDNTSEPGWSQASSEPATPASMPSMLFCRKRSTDSVNFQLVPSRQHADGADLTNHLGLRDCMVSPGSTDTLRLPSAPEPLEALSGSLEQDQNHQRSKAQLGWVMQKPFDVGGRRCSWPLPHAYWGTAVSSSAVVTEQQASSRYWNVAQPAPALTGYGNISVQPQNPPPIVYTAGAPVPIHALPRSLLKCRIDSSESQLPWLSSDGAPSTMPSYASAQVPQTTYFGFQQVAR
mmetsp:Transcript_31482/g.86614  ORF Transcript_31482/g.86614 Transcript_31482/m.86614 type:complete len:373 (-) Transcript_31482:105-1223(-)